VVKHRFWVAEENTFQREFSQAPGCPAKFAGRGNYCRVKWANNSTFQKNCAQEIAENCGK